MAEDTSGSSRRRLENEAAAMKFLCLKAVPCVLRLSQEERRWREEEREFRAEQRRWHVQEATQRALDNAR